MSSIIGIMPIKSKEALSKILCHICSKCPARHWPPEGGLWLCILLLLIIKVHLLLQLPCQCFILVHLTSGICMAEPGNV